MGRKRKTVAQKKLEGTFRADRHPDNVLDLPAEMPTKPEWATHDPIATALYDEISTHVHSMGVSAQSDAIAIGLLADQLSLYLKLRAEVLAEGVIVEVEMSNGASQKKAHPAIAAMNSSYASIVKLLAEYGMTAASRAKVGASSPIVVDSFESFLNS